jgi:hypothetical protein
MAVVLLDLITIGELAILTLDKDPRTDGGYAAPIGQLALINNQGSPVGQLYIKTGAGNTAWELTSTTASAGIVNSGVAGKLALYPATGNTVDDQYTQNSQLIDLGIVAQPTRSAGITYTIPNPGDAVTAASFVLTEGAQTINGNKTFGGNIVINGDLDVNGTVTTIDTTNLQISDKLITLNRGGSAASGGSSGFEIEEGGSPTGYLIQSSARTGWDLKTSASANVATLLQSALTANRTYTLPDVTTVLAGKSGTPTAGYAAFWTDANQLASEQFLNVSRGGTGLSGSTAANGTLLIGNGTGYTLATLTGTANQVIVTNGAGSITLSLPQSIAAGSSPTFTGLTLSSLGAGVVHSSAGGVLSSSPVVLTSEVSGILPIANGGTNSSTALNNGRIMVSVGGAIVEHASITAGSVYFGAASTGLPSQDNANFFWDASNVRLGIKTSSPLDPLHVAGNVRVSGTGSTLRLLAESDCTISQATVATTDATVTTLATISTTTDTVMLIETRVSGRRTGGSAGTAGDSASYVRTARVKNIAGTVTIANLQSDYTSEDQGGWNATITVTGTNVLVRVTGAANNNITWQATVIRTVV